MFTFLIFALLAFAIYLYFQAKVKNHSNYPVVYAMLLGFLVYASGSSLPQWIIDNLNAHTTLALTPYEPLSGYKMLGFGVFLIVLVALYVMKKQAFRAVYLFAFIGLLFVFFLKESNSQENNFWAFFNFGNVNQSIGGDAIKEYQEELKRKIEINQKKLDKLLQQRENPTMSVEEKEKLENEILSLRREIIALSVDDRGVEKAQEIMKSASPDIDKALQTIASYNSEKQRKKRKEENKKQANILLYEATLYEQKGAWQEAKKRYEEALEFDNSYENNFNYAYFLQSKTPDYRSSTRYYLVALEKSCYQKENKAPQLIAGAFTTSILGGLFESFFNGDISQETINTFKILSGLSTVSSNQQNYNSVGNCNFKY